MKAFSFALPAASVLLLSLLLLSACLNRAQVEGRPLARPPSSSASTKASTSQAFRDLQEGKKNPSKQLDPSFRRIPPSTSNPTQNKCKPPVDGRRKRSRADSQFP